jgi:predicted O-methyltransferase YrrM
LAPQDARVHRDAGIGLAAIGRFATARTALETSLALDGSLLGARLALGRICLETGDRTAAIAHARRAVADAPHDASSYLELHRALFDDGNLGPCIDAAKRAVELDRDYALAHFFLAGALAVERKHAEALPSLASEHVVSPSLRAILEYVAAHRNSATRFFATTRDTLHFAVAAATLAGPVLEFGVRHGISTRMFAEHVTSPIHGFDSFTGLPERWHGLESGTFSTAGELPEMPANVDLHVGLFEETLPPFAHGLREAPRLIHIDSDLYSSARAVLETLGPIVAPGCVIVFDEYIGNANWREDEFKAFREAAERFAWSYEYLAFSWITGQAAIRIREIDRSGSPLEPTVALDRERR